jgi:hypothetical protein
MSTIANTISLAGYTPRIYDQGSQGSCKANQIVGAVEMQAAMNGQSYHLSRQQLYNDTREAMGTFTTDSGSIASTADYVATHYGIANESDMAYGSKNLYLQSSAAVDAMAATQKVSSVTQLPRFGVSVDDMAKNIGEYLMQGKPVLVDAYVHINFGYPQYDITEPNIGGHAYLVVGIDYTAKTYTVQNSWGTSWADNGYGTINFSDIPGYGAATPIGQDLLGVSVLNGFDGVDVEWTAYRETVAMLYAGIFERCGENSGIMYWANLIGEALIDERGVANAFFQSAEAQDKYGSMTDAQFVDEIFENIMGRDGDTASVAYWSAVLGNGYSRGDLAYDFINLVDTGKDTQSANDRLENMETVVMNYAITFQLGDEYKAQGITALAQVTEDADDIPVILIGLHDAAYGS